MARSNIFIQHRKKMQIRYDPKYLYIQENLLLSQLFVPLEHSHRLTVGERLLFFGHNLNETKGSYV